MFLPHEYQYALYLSLEYDLGLYDPLILNMVSERYPRDEDVDSAADSDSAIDEDEDLCQEMDMEVSEPKVQSSLCNHIYFGNFGNSDLSLVHPASIPSIHPTIDGFIIKIGEITCPLTNSVSADSEGKMILPSCTNKNQNLTMEEEEHEVYGGEILDVGEMEGDVDMSIADDDAAIKELDEMKRCLKEMEEEAAALREMQAKVKKDIGTVPDPASAAASQVNKEEAWDADFVKVDQATLFDLILAANYLNIKSLLDPFDPGGTLTYYFTVMISMLSIFDSISLFPFDPGGT